MLHSAAVPVENIRIKRAYAAPEQGDGARILVDRLWPRGIKKADLALSDWLKDLAPSTELRQWFGHEPARWPEFQQRYLTELAVQEAELQKLRQQAQEGVITLLYSAHDETRNNALVLRDMLLNMKA